MAGGPGKRGTSHFSLGGEESCEFPFLQPRHRWLSAILGWMGVGYRMVGGFFSTCLGFRGGFHGGILPDAESKQRWGNHIFSARLLCAQEIQRVAFILQSGANVALFRVS